MPRRVTDRSLRSDKLRRLHKAALEQGWTSRLAGSGHVEVVSPTGAKFWISATNNGGAMGRNYENTKAAARRAGLDVSEL